MRLGLAWVLWAIGHAVSLPMRRFDFAWLYPAYNRLMLASCEVQGASERGPWATPGV